MKGFYYLDFDSMRNFLWSCQGKYSEKLTRVQMFDYYRYTEDYEEMYKMIQWYGGKVNSTTERG